MSIGESIKNKAFFVSDGDVVCLGKGTASIVAFDQNDPRITQSIELTEGVIYDSIYSKKIAFCEKYASKIKEGATLSIEEVYYSIRQVIVDEKLPIPKKGSNKPKTLPGGKSLGFKPDHVIKIGSRKDQIKELMNKGMTSPSEIAKSLGTNASYVQRLIKEIDEAV
jgi:hypothetical protein